MHRYTRAWRLLLWYDENRLAAIPRTPVSPRASLSLAEAREAIARLRDELRARGEALELFGQESGDQLAAILGNVEQCQA